MLEVKKSDTWCVNADHSMSGSNTGITKICCMYSDKNLTHSLGVDSIKANFEQEDFKKARAALSNGLRYDRCSHCFEEEDAGKESSRLRDNKKYAEWLSKGNQPFEGLAKFELSLGNTCNLKCRTCNPRYSSTWMQEQYDVYEKNNYPTFNLYANELKKYHQYYDDDNPFWEDLENNLSTIKRFDFYGGEPLMSKKMWHILEVAVEKGYAKDIEIHYATNGTQWPANQVEIFKHFRQIQLIFSIDGIGDEFEYMRYPAKWDEVKANMVSAREFKQRSSNIYLGWCVTLSLLNIYSLPNILKTNSDEFKDFGIFLNLVRGPLWYNLNQMPEHIKPAVIEKIESIPENLVDYNTFHYHLPGIVNYIKQGKPSEENWKKFFEYTKIHDQYRNQSFSKIYPEYSQIINF